MQKVLTRTIALALLASLLLLAPGSTRPAVANASPAVVHSAPAAQAGTPIFTFPVVPNSTTSGYFDHQQANGVITFYNGRRNSPGAGFYFQCSSPSMYDWVGCIDPVAGEKSCPNQRELWYDNHKGTDYEYSSSWHTGATCDPGRFVGITRPVYAPARGRVFFAGYDPSRPGNGWHIRLQHDLNGNGNFSDDNFRSIYLHFTADALAVRTGQIVGEGSYLGLGGSTGYSSSPHLHFEIQKSSDNFQYTNWSVDPYGWTGDGVDPWPYQNVLLWRYPTRGKNPMSLPSMILGGSSSPGCPNCGEQLLNGGFESGRIAWVEQGVDIIANTSHPSLPINPYSGSWLGWLGGRNNAFDVLYQDFTVPSGLAGSTFKFMLMVTSAEGGSVNDVMYVNLRAADGSLLQQVDAINNLFTPTNQWVQREVPLPDLNSYQGQTLRISFEASTNATNVTNFYLDNVSLIALAPGQ